MTTAMRNRLLTTACCLLASHAYGATIQLTQSGWTFGGPLVLSFSGQDANHDGQFDQSELTAFQATYSLQAGGATTWTLTDLHPGGFQFSSAQNFLFFATNSAYTLVDSSFQGLVSGSVVDSFLFPVDITDTVPVVVPEPSGLAAFGLVAIGALLNLRLRRSYL